MADPQGRIHRFHIPKPNPGLDEWLKGPECRAEVTRVTEQVYQLYRQMLPVRTGHLQRSADRYVGMGGWGKENDRWFGWVTNDAEYAAVHEWGKGSNRRRYPAFRELRNAAAIISGEGFIPPDQASLPADVRRVTDSRGQTRYRSTKTGRFVKNPFK